MLGVLKTLSRSTNGGITHVVDGGDSAPTWSVEIALKLAVSLREQLPRGEESLVYIGEAGVPDAAPTCPRCGRDQEILRRRSTEF